jgi:hypothetical protein
LCPKNEKWPFGEEMLGIGKSIISKSKSGLSDKILPKNLEKN